MHANNQMVVRRLQLFKLMIKPGWLDQFELKIDRIRYNRFFGLIHPKVELVLVGLSSRTARRGGAGLLDMTRSRFLSIENYPKIKIFLNAVLSLVSVRGVWYSLLGMRWGSWRQQTSIRCFWNCALI
jgi:hypothetical protein